jgi:uncharacterized protein YdhG (YjbR/CyaY superfamily)
LGDLNKAVIGQVKRESMEKKENNYKTIDEYILAFPPEVQEKLKQMREVIKAAAPEAEERISYKMPAFSLKGKLVYFAAFRNHIGFYPTGSGIAKIQKELANYKSGKGSVQFPLDEQLPVELISKVVKLRVLENIKKYKEKRKLKQVVYSSGIALSGKRST